MAHTILKQSIPLANYLLLYYFVSNLAGEFASQTLTNTGLHGSHTHKHERSPYDILSIMCMLDTRKVLQKQKIKEGGG